MSPGQGGSYIAGAMHPLPLHFLHAGRAVTFGAENGREVVETSGPLDAGWQAAQQGAVLYDHSARQVVAVTGPDRVSFVHGMCTQDVNRLTENAAADATLLTAKGAMVADARIVKLPEVVLLDVEPGLAPKVLEFLDKYLISEEAELADVSASWGQLGVYGPRAAAIVEAALGVAGAPADTRHSVQSFTFAGAQGLLIGNPSYASAGVDVWLPPEVLEQAFRALESAGALPIGRDVLEVLRVEGGWPRYGADLTDTTIPLEAHLERAISYNKGCYIGQEVIARATFRGQMNRKLAGLLLGEQQPAPGTAIFEGERKIGWLTSIVYSPARKQHVALGYVNRNFLTEGTELKLDGGGQVTVAALPLVTR